MFSFSFRLSLDNIILKSGSLVKKTYLNLAGTKVQLRGKSPQNALPVLATYMGHCEYKYTVKYLKMIDAEKRNQFLDFAVQQKEKR